MMNQLSIDLKNAKEVADLLSDKNAGDTAKIMVLVTIAEKDGERFVADIDEVLEVDGETLAEEAEEKEPEEADETEEEGSKAPMRFGKGRKPSSSDEE